MHVKGTLNRLNSSKYLVLFLRQLKNLTIYNYVKKYS